MKTHWMVPVVAVAFIYFLGQRSMMPSQSEQSESTQHIEQLERLGYETDSADDTARMVLKCKKAKYLEFCKRNKLGEFAR